MFDKADWPKQEWTLLHALRRQADHYGETRFLHLP